MKEYAIKFTPEAESQLAELYGYIANASSPQVAERYLGAIMTYCDSLKFFPLRGTRRDDIRPGIRTTNYRKRAVIAFTVDTDAIIILGVFYGGRDYETLLARSLRDESRP